MGDKASLGTHNHQGAQRNPIVEIADIPISHAHAAVGHRLANQLLILGAVESELHGLIRRKADPAISEGIIFAGRENFMGEGMLPGGMGDHLADAKLPDRRLPAFLANGDSIAGGELVAVVDVSHPIAEIQDQTSIVGMATHDHRRIGDGRWFCGGWRGHPEGRGFAGTNADRAPCHHKQSHEASSEDRLLGNGSHEHTAGCRS